MFIRRPCVLWNAFLHIILSISQLRWDTIAQMDHIMTLVEWNATCQFLLSSIWQLNPANSQHYVYFLNNIFILFSCISFFCASGEFSGTKFIHLHPARHHSGLRSCWRRRIMKPRVSSERSEGSVTAGEPPPLQSVLMSPARALCGFSSRLSDQDLEIKSRRNPALFLKWHYVRARVQHHASAAHSRSQAEAISVWLFCWNGPFLNLTSWNVNKRIMNVIIAMRRSRKYKGISAWCVCRLCFETDIQIRDAASHYFHDYIYELSEKI